MTTDYNKHILDTSFLYPMILGPKFYKQYIVHNLGTTGFYISKYVQMEFVRGFLCPVLDFYFILDMPNIKTIGDAINIWSNRFSSRELKSILRFLSQIFSTRGHNLEDLRDKKSALTAIEQIIFRISSILKRKFKNIGVNSTRCKRAEVPLKFAIPDDRKRTYQQFLYAFRDEKTCQSKCVVNEFFKCRFKSEVENFYKYSEGISNPTKSQNIGFIKIVKKLKKTVKKDVPVSCRVCGAIGDAIIALESNRDMRLEHLDYSFDHLCEIIGQPHFRHPSENTLMKSAK